MMRVFVRWPNDSTLPVRIDPSESVASLIEMISLAVATEITIVLTMGNRVLIPAQTIEDQSVTEDAVLLAHFIPHFPEDSFDFFSEDDEVDSDIDCHFDSLYQERLRLNDISFNNIEMHRRPQNFYAALLDFETAQLPPIKTEIPTEKVLSEEPLPKLWTDDSKSDSDDSEGESLPKFASLREVGEFFARRKWHPWMNLH